MPEGGYSDGYERRKVMKFADFYTHVVLSEGQLLTLSMVDRFGRKFEVTVNNVNWINTHKADESLRAYYQLDVVDIRADKNGFIVTLADGKGSVIDALLNQFIGKNNGDETKKEPNQ